MAKFDSKKFINHLQEKWKARPCPMCGSGPWNIQDSTYQLMEFTEGVLRIGGPVIPVVPVICANCGHTVLVNAIISGVVQPSPEATVEKPK
jgi:hypothetical protein